jgi:hypothetical protein
VSEIVYSTAIGFSKKEIFKYGINPTIEASLKSLGSAIEEEYIDLIAENLDENNNVFQFTLTIKRIDFNEAKDE